VSAGPLGSTELKKAKRAVRRAVIALRDALPPEERAARSAAIAERALGLPELRAARAVVAFWAFGSEVDTAPLLRSLAGAGVVTGLPRIDAGELAFHAYADGDPVAPTSFGAMEPVGGDELDLATIDVVVTPGVAFDHEGRRVGYGGGFYDRLFARLPEPARVAVTFDLQVVEEALPAGAFDLRVDAVVTETRVLRFSRTD
jgi:5-formyltetrahydrofolate cyclo-ligase